MLKSLLVAKVSYCGEPDRSETVIRHAVAQKVLGRHGKDHDGFHQVRVDQGVVERHHPLCEGKEMKGEKRAEAKLIRRCWMV